MKKKEHDCLTVFTQGFEITRWFYDTEKARMSLFLEAIRALVYC